MSSLTGALVFLVLVGTFSQSVEASSKVPWERQYKIKPNETDRLTPADVVGPEGLVYPNWTKCGVQGGIPKVKAVVSIEDFGGKADDEAADDEALAKACEAAGKRGGGAVLLDEGTYYLDRPVTVRHDNMVIRGKGPNKTRLIFRYSIPKNGVTFYHPPAGSKVGKNTRLEMHCKPTGLMKMTMMVDDVVIGRWNRSQHSGNTFAFARYGRDAIGKVQDGRHILKGIAEYKDGSKRAGEIAIILDSSFDDKRVVADSRAAITFAGRGRLGRRFRLTKDGKRGDMTLKLKSAKGLKVGDYILIDGPATQRWKRLTKNACKWGTYRHYEVIVTSIKNNIISINQPLRIEFPVIDGCYVQKVKPIQRCGIESVCIEQAENLWISGVIFYHGWNCWARDVTVKKCGRFAVYGSMAKWCEIRDCVFDDAWFKGAGGTAYTGWDRCWDCLIENVEQLGRKSENRSQKTEVRRQNSEDRSQKSEDRSQISVLCPLSSVFCPLFSVLCPLFCGLYRPGVWMGGMNENWLILYSRFVVGNGPGVFIKTTSFDHIIKGNVFVLKDNHSPMVLLAGSDCIGTEIIANKLYGGDGRFVSGQGKPSIVKDNKAFPLRIGARPIPQVPSIYEWQQSTCEQHSH